MNLTQIICNHFWAITPDMLETLIQISQRDNLDPEALAARLGRPLDNTHNVEKRGGVAVLPVRGPLFRHANLFHEISGATSYDLLAMDFTAALEDPGIHAIVLNIDSPGGEANGTQELAALIHQARGRKPVVAYVGGLAASAGYWLASAADEIVIDPTALLGSIGVRSVLTDTREMERSAGIRRYSIVSSQSPNKDVDPANDSDLARVQRTLDDLAQIFIDRVAQYRGVTVETVLNQFGGGDVLVGQKAIEAGLADRLGSLESVIAELQDSQKTSSTSNEVIPMSETSSRTYSDEEITLLQESAYEAGFEEGQSDLVAKIKKICYSELGKKRPSMALKLAINEKMPVESALEILEAMPEETPQNSFDRHMQKLGNPDVGADLAEADNEDWKRREATALEFVNKMAGGLK